MNKVSAFNSIRALNQAKIARTENSMNDTLKNLMNGLLNSIQNEQKFFETLNFAINSVTKCKNSEVLLVDKVHRTIYGYPSPFTVLKS